MNLFKFAVVAVAVTSAGAVYAATAVTVDDTNGDGVYSMDELKAAFPNITEEIFTKADTNADGSVDPAELTAAEDSGLLTTTG